MTVYPPLNAKAADKAAPFILILLLLAGASVLADSRPVPTPLKIVGGVLLLLFVGPAFFDILKALVNRSGNSELAGTGRLDEPELDSEPEKKEFAVDLSDKLCDRLIEVIKKIMEAQHKDRFSVLNFGVGSANFGDRLLTAFKKIRLEGQLNIALSYCGVGEDSHKLEHAKSRLSQFAGHFNLDWLSCSVENMPKELKDRKFDVILLFEVLCDVVKRHPQDDTLEKVIKRIHDLLDKGGVLFVIDYDSSKVVFVNPENTFQSVNVGKLSEIVSKYGFELKRVANLAEWTKYSKEELQVRFVLAARKK